MVGRTGSLCSLLGVGRVEPLRRVPKSGSVASVPRSWKKRGESFERGSLRKKRSTWRSCAEVFHFKFAVGPWVFSSLQTSWVGAFSGSASSRSFRVFISQTSEPSDAERRTLRPPPALAPSCRASSTCPTTIPMRLRHSWRPTATRCVPSWQLELSDKGLLSRWEVKEWWEGPGVLRHVSLQSFWRRTFGP